MRVRLSLFEATEEIPNLEVNGITPSLDDRINELYKRTQALIIKTFGEDFFEENDTHPYIRVANLGPRRAGECDISYDVRDRTRKTIKYTCIKINKYVDDFSDAMLYALVIHEYVHSLKCCIFGGKENGGHNATWKRIAGELSNAIGVEASVMMNAEEVSSMVNTYNGSKKTYYKLTCDHCGHESFYYSGSAYIIKYPDHYRHRCSDGTKGTFTVEKVVK